MDKRVIKPLPTQGIYNIPNGAVAYSLKGQQVVDFIAPTVSKEEAAKEEPEAILITCMESGGRPEYAKRPPADYVPIHTFGGWDVDETPPVVEAAEIQ